MDLDAKRAREREYYERNKERMKEQKRASYKRRAAKARAQKLQYNAANRDTIRRKSKARYDANKEEILETRRLDYAEDPEHFLAINKAWRERNSEHMKNYNATYAATHRDEINENLRKRYAEDPSFAQTAHRRRRAHKKGAPVNDFTAEQWRVMQEIFDHRCAYCGKRAKGHLTQDHLTPLSQGGSHTWSNILPACRSCNSKKHTGPVLSPVQPLLL